MTFCRSFPGRKSGFREIKIRRISKKWKNPRAEADYHGEDGKPKIKSSWRDRKDRCKDNKDRCKDNKDLCKDNKNHCKDNEERKLYGDRTPKGCQRKLYKLPDLSNHF